MSLSNSRLCGLLALLAVLAAGCERKKQAAAKRPPPPVRVTAAAERTVPVELHTIGRVEPYATVAITARVSGQIIDVGFSEGQDIAEDQMLFKIDPRPFEAALKQAEANLQREKILLHKAEGDVKRYEELYRSRTVPEESFEEVKARLDSLRSQVAASAAAVEAAQVQLGYCTINAPLAGRSGDLKVDAGNLVKGDDSPPLVMINQVRPIYVKFTLPEQHLTEVRRHLRAGTIAVKVITPSDPEPVLGELSFMDNAVDRHTGTIEMKATFTNVDERLWPGQFVDVSLVLRQVVDAVLVPNEAVQPGQQGPYVLVIDDKNIAEMRPVKVAFTVGQDVVIGSGLRAGERVVIDGHMRVLPKEPVTIKRAESEAKLASGS